MDFLNPPADKQVAATSQASIGPNGEVYPLPTDDDYAKERERLEALVAAHRQEGREVVVVMGVGFVGAVMAGVVADSLDKATGKPGKFVIAMQRPSVRSFWKIPYLNLGIPPVQSEDPEVEAIIRRCVLEKGTLTATFTYDALSLADVVVVDVQCDYVKDALGDMRKGHADIAALEESFKVIGERIQPHCMVLIETTVPPGTTEHIAYPIIKRCFEARGLMRPTGSHSAPRTQHSAFRIPHSEMDSVPDPLLAHSYERVMPGRHYVASVRDFWRVCSGVSPAARERVVRFLSEVLNVEKYPLTVMDRPIESETSKIVENSYRATILAFMDEWSLFAERNGIDLVKVIQAIKVRPTHSNILFPGPGIGGYCLPKDGALGLWACENLLNSKFEIRNSKLTDSVFRIPHSAFGMDSALRIPHSAINVSPLPITTAAININDTRGLRAAELAREALEAMGRPVAGAPVLLCGASYREDVGDTRYSGSEIIARRLAELGAEIRVHDPYVDHWHELEHQDTYPATGQSRARFFKNQDSLGKVRVEKDLASALRGASAIILAVRHSQYLDLDPDWLVAQAGGPFALVDCFALLLDEHIRKYFELGCEVRGLGRGHIHRMKEDLKAQRPDL